MRRWRVPLAMLLAYLLIISCAGLRDKLVIHPSTYPITAVDAEQLRFSRRDGGTTAAFASLSPGAMTHPIDAFILDFPGNGTRAEMLPAALARRWQNHPVEVIVVNYPGFGASTGPASMDKIPPMALDAYDSVAKLANGKPVIVTGHSLGSAVALYVAAHRPAAGVVIQNPPPLKQLIIGRFGWWNLWLGAIPIALQIPKDLDAIANARLCREPAVLLSADHDTYVPPKYHHLVIDAYAGPHKLISFDGGHNTAPTHSSDYYRGLDWLWQQIGLPAVAPATMPTTGTREFAG